MSSNGLEIERKFLVRHPDSNIENVRKQIDIIQTYLVSGDNGSQRRVRKISENGSVTYVYTEKIFYTAVTRQETEFEITKEQYEELIKQPREDCKPVSKRRVCFEYMDQLFELDLYPFSDELAIMELELRSPEQEIIFPPFINVISEVTGINEYSNSSLANAGAFPDDVERKRLAEGDI